MHSLVYVVLWVLPSVLVGVAAGYYLGHGKRAPAEDADAAVDREQMLKSLVTLLQSTQQLTTDVDSHSVELRQVGRTVGELHLTGELQHVQVAMLEQIGAVLNSNERLEGDLIYARYRLEEQAQELDRTRLEARTDALSGVANRKAFDESLQYLLAAHAREGLSFALILADVDHFKWINDTHGHPAGDRVVSEVGKCLQQALRQGDYVARYGGDEFALLLKGVDRPTAEKVADRIRVMIARRGFELGEHDQLASVTFSMGLALVADQDTPQTILARADQALYKSKHAGRNQLHSAGLTGEPVKVTHADSQTDGTETWSSEPSALGAREV